MKHLSEQNYQKGKRALTYVGIGVIVLGLALGMFLIVTGAIKLSDKTNETDDTITIAQLEQKIDELEKEEIQLQLQKNKEFDENQFSEKYYTLQNQLSDIRKEISETESEIWKLESGFGQNKNTIERSKGMMFIIPGISVIMFGLIIGTSILGTAYRRNILAWRMQQVMPIVGEGLETMAPTVTKVAKEQMEEIAPTIAKVSKEQLEVIAPALGEVAKEIKKWLQDKDN